MLLLGLSVLLIYSVFSFVFLHDMFDARDHLYCSTLIQCYITVIREGLLNSLAVVIKCTVCSFVISMQRIPVDHDFNEPSFTVYWSRTLFDLSFFVIVTILGLNVVIAVILDAFSDLRKERVSHS